jgi:DNA-directed RNA polymerase specialized sigma subunit
MGMVKRDIHKKEKNLEEKYNLRNKRGVYYLLEDINNLRVKVENGCIDTCLLLIDFEDAMKKANLSDREKEVLHYRFDKDLTMEETAEALNLVWQTVQTYEKRAIEKITEYAKSIWEEE